MKSVFNKLRTLHVHEIISLSFSLVAIVLGLITAYFQFFYSKEELLLTVIELKYDGNNKKLDIDLALVNGGTESFLITSYSVGVTDKNKLDGDVFSLRVLGDALISNGGPFIIKPKEVLLKNLNISLTERDIVRLSQSKCLPHNIFIGFMAISNNGKHYSSETLLASFHEGSGSSFVRIYRDLVNLLHSGVNYRSDNKTFSGHDVTNLKPNKSNYDCLF